MTRNVASSTRRFIVPVTAACLAAATMVVLAERERLVAMAPFTEPAYAAIGLGVNTRGLAIEDVRAQSGNLGDKSFLVVRGWIANLRDAETTSPDLRIALRGADGRELYVWTARPQTRRLARAERVPFAARLEAPPQDVRDATVRFVVAGS